MTIQIISIGKASDHSIQDLINEYEERLKAYCKLDWVIMPPAKLADASAAVADESQRLLRAIKPNDIAVLLDERGTIVSNQQFAVQLEGWLGQQGKLVIIIGGAHGVTDEVRSRANFVWSLSKLVFPHRIVRLILTEQIYRAFAIIHNHPYHHV
jgi:23S rRNA (pseudouridine1915-N3)-methyltransferase